jgi:hypothetical protein
VARSPLNRRVLAAALGALVLSAPATARAAEIDPCSLVPAAQVAAMTGGTGKGRWNHGTGGKRYSQETCHYDGPLKRAVLVAVHLDARPFATVKSMLKPLAGVGADAVYMHGPPSVIAFLKHGHYVSMSWNADPGKPSPQFLAAAKAAAAKL